MAKRNRNINKHHVMFQRSQHEASPNGRELRNYEGLLIPMWVQGHEKLHEECNKLPILSNNSYIYMLDTLDTVVSSRTTSIEMIKLLATCAIEIKEDTTLNRREYVGLTHFTIGILSQVPFIERYAVVEPILI